MNNIKHSLTIHPHWLEMDKEIGNNFFTLFSLLPPQNQNLIKSWVGTPFITASWTTWVKDIELGETLIASDRNFKVARIFNISPALERNLPVSKGRIGDTSRHMFGLYLYPPSWDFFPPIHISAKTASNCGPWERLNKPFYLTISKVKEITSLSLIYKIHFKRGSVKISQQDVTYRRLQSNLTIAWIFLYFSSSLIN